MPCSREKAAIVALRGALDVPLGVLGELRGRPWGALGGQGAARKGPGDSATLKC